MRAGKKVSLGIVASLLLPAPAGAKNCFKVDDENSPESTFYGHVLVGPSAKLGVV
jgi:hypothetical protein